ncbi:MAG: DUF1761 domain-containing protein [Hyphomicrobiales bacterium]|nr:DUF1761 domain-containing protein [Hyphomicrobiales bacterium]MBV8427537.1 DUF1761 domain-containing protein [Hyphomicrobiales bacterium]
MVFAGLNYLAVFVAAIGAFAFGAAYYGILGKKWMAALGKTEAELKGPHGKISPFPFILSFVAELVMAWALAGVLGHLGPGQVTVTNGAISAFFLWLGFVLTTVAVSNAYARRKLALTAIDSAHWLGVLVIEGVIIGAFGI